MAVNDHLFNASDDQAPGAPPRAAVLLPVRTAAQMLGIGRTKAYELIGAGELELVHIGRSALVPAESVHEFVRRLRAQASGSSGPSSRPTGVVQLWSSPSDDSQPPAA
ncbi:MAG: helix-turn-helix domain-containing protein [Microthrixaceae bacterium]